MKIFLFENYFNLNKECVAERSIKQLIPFHFSTKLGVLLKSTSSPYYEWKGKSKDYH